MTEALILTVNGGSSSLKCGLFAAADPGRPVREFNMPNAAGTTDGIDACLREIATELGGDTTAGTLAGIGHRVVHGGDRFDGPVVVDGEIMQALRDLVPLAPLHQPVNLRLIESCGEIWPGIPQVACFDTAFHRSMPTEASSYALPREMTAAGLHAYGFHGLSYEFIVDYLKDLGECSPGRRIIVAHLGAGASLCAIKGDKSVATTMGFSTAEGLPMMTRTGSIDPGILIHLVRERGMMADDLERLVYRQGGLRGMSGITGGMRELLASTDSRAREAIDFFVYRIVREIGSLAAALEGLDMLVFTGGIGANEASIREAVVERFGWLDEPPEVLAVPANEEAIIARHARRLLQT